MDMDYGHEHAIQTRPRYRHKHEGAGCVGVRGCSKLRYSGRIIAKVMVAGCSWRCSCVASHTHMHMRIGTGRGFCVILCQDYTLPARACPPICKVYSILLRVCCGEVHGRKKLRKSMCNVLLYLPGMSTQISAMQAHATTKTHAIRK